MSYGKILLCVDNSKCSDYAVENAAAIGRLNGTSIVSAHVYAARLHDRRFVDLEPGLPKEFQNRKRMERSRKTHDSLIGKGLELISDSYLVAIRERLEGVSLEEKSIEGKNYVELVRESKSGYDLAIIGAQGLGLEALNGAGSPHALGSVCERFLRGARTDVFVVKNERSLGGKLLVGVDGSPESYSALRKALKLAKEVGAKVEVVACYDPDYHPVAFKSIAGVLSEADSKVFRFKSQEKLHDNIINKGLETLYQGYLENANVIAKGRGTEIDSRVLEGKPAYEIARRAEEIDATLVVVSRLGLHHTDCLDIGNTAENVVRISPCNVLVVHEKIEKIDIKWTADAEERIKDIPDFIRPMVRKAIENHARARGISEITSQIVTDAKVGHGVPLPGHGKKSDEH